MKASRILAYGAIGIITGLLIENRALVGREAVKARARKLKNKVSEDIDKIRQKVKA